MSHVRRHFKNTAALLISGGASKLFAFLATIRIIKALSIPDNGAFNLALTFGIIFNLMTELGVRGYLMRELARTHDDPAHACKLFGDVFNLRLALIVAVAPLSFVVLWATGYDSRVIALAGWFLLYAIMDSLAMLLKFVLRGYERMEFDAVFSMLGRGLLLVLILFFAQRQQLNLVTVTVSHLISAAVECTGLMIGTRMMLPLRFLNRIDWAGMRAALARSLPFAAVNVLGILYLRTGTVALSKFSGEDAVAYFNTAARFPEAATFLPMALVNAVVPFLSRNAGNVAMMRRYFDFMMRYIGLAGVFLAAVFVFEPRFVILLLAKPEYLVVEPTFQWYGLWMLFSFLHYATANILICLNEEKWVMRLFALALAVNIVLNLLLVPLFGVTGAAVALAATELICLALDLTRLHRHSVVLTRRWWMQVPGLGAVLCITLAAATGQPVLAQLGALSAVAAVYVACAGWVQDRDVLARLLGRPAQQTAQ